jgi:hypothetical protein
MSEIARAAPCRIRANHSNLQIDIAIALPDQHRKLENKNRSGCGADRKNRLRDPDGKSFVCHVPTPLS